MMPQSLKTIDLLKESLSKNYRSKKARTVKQAYDALMGKKPGEARTLVASLRSDPLYQDYAFWISAAAHRLDAERALDGKKPDGRRALTHTEKALTDTLEISTRQPYSPFLKTLERDTALGELLAADANLELGKKKSARESFERAFQRLSNQGAMSRLRPDHLARYAETCVGKAKRGQTPPILEEGLCLPWLGRFAALYPKSSEESKALARLVPAIFDRARLPQYASRITQAYKAPDLDQTAFDAGMALYMGEKYDDAIETFRKFLVEYPKSAHRHRAKYWLAQSLTQEQEHEDARKLYTELREEAPLGYYGMLASLAIAQDIDSAVDLKVPEGEESDPSLMPVEAFRIERARAFVAERAFELVSFELRDFKWRDTSSNDFLMFLAALNYEAKNYNGTFVVLTELIQRGFRGVYTSSGVKMVFPTPHLDLVQRYASELKLDPILVLSLIKQESAFDAGAVSGAGAMGLMQLMPTTAVETIPTVPRSELTEPEPNIRVGTTYLRKVLNRFNGNIALALAGYNAGPNAADRWYKALGPKKGLLEFIETIPYKETREYVATIIRNYFWYSKLLNGETPKSLGYFWNTYGPPEKPVELPGDSTASATSSP
jgi:soluble lytic murein transglycosylase-like protein